MNIGFVGLGKLGLPVALSIESKGHRVVGYDVNPEVGRYIKERKIPYREAGTPELLKGTKIKFLSLDQVVLRSDIVFCPVQTPHHPMYEGVTRIPEERVDFDYSYLVSAVRDIAASCERNKKDITLIIISTVLPGTIEREIVPLLNRHITLCYNPFFIAMGTTRSDFEKPEFVLLGCDNDEVASMVEGFYKTIHSRPVFKTTIRNAELIKVVYNTFISTKIAYINTIQEVCDKIGANIDDISDALALANERIVSPKYLRGGMPDGGGCHPRDNIALSWLSRKLNLKFDWFDAIMTQREKQIESYADRVERYVKKHNLPVVICGQAFKAGTNLTIGSPSVLLQNILSERGIKVRFYDPHTLPETTFPEDPAIYFIGTNHEEFGGLIFPQSSVVIDPWGIVGSQDGVELVSIGRR